jgi:superfamily II DNA or RNA helicase
MELRPYQQTIVDQIRDALRRGVRSPLVVSPTGSGKTAIFCHIAADAWLDRLNGAAPEEDSILPF